MPEQSVANDLVRELRRTQEAYAALDLHNTALHRIKCAVEQWWHDYLKHGYCTADSIAELHLSLIRYYQFLKKEDKSEQSTTD